jgi:hypothetical protein
MIYKFLNYYSVPPPPPPFPFFQVGGLEIIHKEKEPNLARGQIIKILFFQNPT